MPIATALLGLSLAAEPTVRLEVLDPGQEPRSALSAQPAVGTTDVVTYNVRFTAEVVNEGISLPSATLPSLQLRLRSEVKQAADGSVRAAITVPSVSVGSDSDALDDDVRAAAEKAMRPITKVVGMVSVDAFGALKGAEWSTSDDTAVEAGLVSELERALDLLLVRRPAEPLGEGARWTVTRSGTDAMGFQTTDVETWTLSSVGSEGWTLDLTTLQQAEVPQQIGGSTLQSHTGAAQGQATLDPAHLFPTKVELGLSLRTRMLLEGAVRSTTTSTLQAEAVRTAE